MFQKIVKVSLFLIMIFTFSGCDILGTENCRNITDKTEEIVDSIVQEKKVEDIEKLKIYIDGLTNEQKSEKLDCWVNSFGGGIDRDQLNGLSIIELYEKYSLIALENNGFKSLEAYQAKFAKSKGFNTYSQYKKAEAEKLALANSNGFDTYAEYKKEEEKRANLELAKSKGYNSFPEYLRGETKKGKIANEQKRLKKEKAERIAQAKAEKKRQKAEMKRKANARAARITLINRNELGRVLNRPSKFIGKIIKFKDKVDWDYVTEFQMLDTGNKNYKFKQIMTIKMKGANWSSIEQPLLFMPKDIFDAIDNDFYNKTSKNFTDYQMQSNEMELITLSGVDFTKMFGSKATGKYIYPNDTVILITNIKIYNRKLGTYQTRMFNY